MRLWPLLGMERGRKGLGRDGLSSVGGEIYLSCASLNPGVEAFDDARDILYPHIFVLYEILIIA